MKKTNSKKRTNNFLCDISKPIKVTEMGNITELLYMSNRNTKATIKMLEGGHQYIELSTGEIKDVIHHQSRIEQLKSLYRTFRSLRNLINTNITNVKNVRWITLTYRENMRDTTRLYNDFEKFNKRFQYYIKKLGYNKAEYIVVPEPQGRGAWHMHLIYIFDKQAPFIDNDSVLAPMWRQGFTKTKSLKEVDNVGAYLTAYLGDIAVDELEDNPQLLVDFVNSKSFGGELNLNLGTVKEIEVANENGQKIKKRYVKGGRLVFYPSNFRIYRTSRGIKRPTEHMMMYDNAIEFVKGQKLIYEKTSFLSDASTEFESVVNKRHYSKI